MDNIKLLGRHFKHFKGTVYVVRDIVYGAEKEEIELRVLYSEPGKILVFSRPLDNFIEHVDRPDYNYSGPRFVEIQ